MIGRLLRCAPILRPCTTFVWDCRTACREQWTTLGDEQAKRWPCLITENLRLSVIGCLQSWANAPPAGGDSPGLSVIARDSAVGTVRKLSTSREHVTLGQAVTAYLAAPDG